MKIVLQAASRGSAWLGGLHYFKGLVQALRAHPASDGSTVTVLTNEPAAFGAPSVDGVTIVEASWLDPTRPVGFANGALNTLVQFNPLLRRHARMARADVVTHATPGFGSPCQILFWMPDFQHRYLPGNFSRYERWRRDRNVRASARHGHILFSSQSAAADFRRLYPDMSGTVAHVLRFQAAGTDATPATQDDLRRRYDLPESYFLVPNQFWKHKNHKVVVDALATLPDRYVVVCTGAMEDSRGDQHIRDLRQAISKGALERRFRTLGVVPREDMLALMHHATCVINPSLFEGWSTVVQEARLAGKQMILSDIPVHREQDPMDAMYFMPTDADALASAMERAAGRHDPAMDQHRAALAAASRPAEVAAFAEAYWSIARVVATRGHR